MKVDRKTKAEKIPPSKKTAKTVRRTARRTNGEYPLAAYEHVPVGIVKTSLMGNYVDVNEEFCRILGYSRRELLRRGIKDCTHKDDYGLDDTLYEKLTAGKIPFYRLEKRYVRKDGEIIWVELTRTLVCDAKGKPLHTMGVVLDISDRKDVERVLRESVERLRLATESARMFMWEWDFQNQIYKMDDNFEKVVGFSAGLLPQNQAEAVLKLSPPEDMQTISEAVNNAIERRGDLHSLQYRMINPVDGQMVWLEANGKIAYDEEGNARRMFGVAQNITENKEAETALQLAHRQAEQFADRTARLQKVTAALSEALTPPQVADALTKQGASALGAVSSSMLTLSEDGQTLEIMYSTSDESLIRPYKHFPVSLNVPAADAVRSGQIVWLESRQQYLERYPHLAGQINLWGQQAAIAVPMIYKNRIQGVFTLSFDRVLAHTLEDENYILTLARQGAQALERARAEDALRESEERFRAMISQTTAGIAESDMESRLVFVNPGFYQMLGYSEEELLGKTIWELTYTEDLEENKRLFERLLTQGESYQFENRFIRKDGSLLWTTVSVTTIHGLSGKPKGGVAVVIDIDKRKKAERALGAFARQQEALYRLSDQLHRADSLPGVFDAALDAILSALQCDSASILLYDNTDVMRFVAWRGLSEGYRKATDGHSPWRPDAKDPKPITMDDVRTADLDESLRTVIQEEGIGALAFIPLVIDEKLIGKFMIYYDAPHMFNEAELDLSLTIAHQLAFGVDRKRTEQALKRERELFQRLFETMPVMVSMYDPETNSLRLNAEFERLLGWKSEEVTVVSLLESLYPDPEYRNDVLQRMAVAGRNEWVEARAQTRDGRTLDSMWSNISIMNDQKLVTGIALGIDITERTKTEEALRASEERMRLATDAAGMYAWEFDIQKQTFTLSDNFAEVLGFQAELVPQDNVEVLQRFSPAEDVQTVHEAMTQAFEKQEDLRDLQYRIVNPESGQMVWVEVNARTIYDRKGKPERMYGVSQNITERKRIEEALLLENERFMRFVNSNIVGIVIGDASGKIMLANDYYLRLLGVSRQDLDEGMVDWKKFTPPEWLPADEKAIQELREHGACEPYEKEYIRADGSRVPSYIANAVLPGPGDEIAAFVLDISERKRAEESLRESEERFRAILRQATAGIVRKDPEGRLIFVNQAFCNMLGSTEADLLGKTIWDFMHKDDIAQNRQSYERLIKEGIPFKLERRLIREDGSIIWVDASISPIMDATGKPQSAVGVEVDITGRKQAEEALQQLNLQLEDRVLSRTAKLRAVNQTLREEIAERKKVEEALRKSEAAARENEEKLSTLFNLLPVGISFLDLDGQIIQMNSALANILKLSREPLSDQVYRSRKYIRANGTLMSPTEFASRRALIEGRTIYNVETGVVLENSEVVWTSVSAAPVDVADVGAVVVTVDITESKLAERALQESRERLRFLSQRLVEVQEEERRAIARELHDRVGQTLAALNINLIIISGQLGVQVDEQISTRLNDSMKLVAETISLVRDVMSNLRPSVLDDYGLEAAIESHLSQYVSRYEIDAKFEKPDHPVPRMVPGIEMTFLRIAQEALMNIARHAHASQVNLSLWQEENTVCMVVQDNGLGITSWQEANRPGSHGLTIMRERAEAFSGSLIVSSGPGKGTKVEVRIPIESNNPAQAQKEMSQ